MLPMNNRIEKDDVLSSFFFLSGSVGNFARHGAELSVRVAFPPLKAGLGGLDGIKRPVIVIVHDSGSAYLHNVGVIPIHEIIW